MAIVPNTRSAAVNVIVSFSKISSLVLLIDRVVEKCGTATTNKSGMKTISHFLIENCAVRYISDQNQAQRQAVGWRLP
jgi:uncharacterized metal-binding protein